MIGDALKKQIYYKFKTVKRRDSQEKVSTSSYHKKQLNIV